MTEDFLAVGMLAGAVILFAMGTKKRKKKEEENGSE